MAWRVVAIGPCVGLAVLLALGKADCLLLPAQVQRLRDGFVLMCVASTAIGIAVGNIPRYLFADLFRCSVAWIAFFSAVVAVRYLPANQKRRGPERVVDALALVAIVDALGTIALGMATTGARLSTLFHAFGVGWGLFRSGRSMTVRTAVLLVCSAAVIYSGKRGNLVGIAGALSLMLPFAGPVLGRGLRSAVRVLAPVGVAAALYVLYAQHGGTAGLEVQARQDRTVESLVTAASGERADASFASRLDEVRNVLRFLKESPEFVPLGAGFGAVVPTYGWTGITSEVPGHMHTVHIGWVVYTLRNGILGLLLYSAFFALTLSACLRRTAEYRDARLCCAFFVGFCLILSFKSPMMLEQLHLPVAAGVGMGLAFHRKRTAADPPRMGRRSPVGR